jgi:hypothetical protein
MQINFLDELGEKTRGKDRLQRGFIQCNEEPLKASNQNITRGRLAHETAIGIKRGRINKLEST